MAPRNARTNRPMARSSRALQSAKAVRTAKAAQSGRIASRSDAAQFSNDAPQTSNPYSRYSTAQPGGYRSAYDANSQGHEANNAYARQTATSQYSRSNANYASKAKKKSGRGKKIAIGVVISLFVVLIGAGSAFALYINSINSQLNRGDKSQEELDLISDVLAPTTSFTEPFYMMLIGSDKLDDVEGEGARSDTNIVVRVDPTTNAATMISIPRDTLITLNGSNTKFNAAYSAEGAAGAIREASELLNVDISHYAEVNFDNLKSLVDAVGGVDIEVTERVDDPDADGTSAHPEWPRVIIEEGMQHLDGNQALVFARSRAYADGDFTRTANQRKLITNIVNKVLALPVTELPSVIQSAAQCVTTDLSVGDIVGLAQQFKEGGELAIYSAMVPSTTGYIGDVSYVFTDETALKEMMTVVEEGGDPSTITASASASASAYANSGGTGSSSSGYSTGNSSGYSTGTTGTDYYGTGTGATGTGTSGGGYAY